GSWPPSRSTASRRRIPRVRSGCRPTRSSPPHTSRARTAGRCGPATSFCGAAARGRAGQPRWACRIQCSWSSRAVTAISRSWVTGSVSSVIAMQLRSRSITPARWSTIASITPVSRDQPAPKPLATVVEATVSARPSGATPIAVARSATSSVNPRAASTNSSRARCRDRKCGPITVQCACLPISDRSIRSTRAVCRTSPVVRWSSADSGVVTGSVMVVLLFTVGSRRGRCAAACGARAAGDTPAGCPPGRAGKPRVSACGRRPGRTATLTGMTAQDAAPHPDLLRTAADTVAVVGAAGAGTAIWHVDIGPTTGLPRLCGAWVLEADRSAQITALLTGRYVLAVAGSDLESAASGAELLGTVEPARIVDEVTAEIDRLQEAFDAEGRKLVAPVWPPVPAPPADAAAAAGAAPQGADPDAAATLGTARWLRAIAEAWAKVESAR